MFFLFLVNLSLPLDSPFMENVEYLQTRGLGSLFLIKPYEISEVITQIEAHLLKEINLNSIDRYHISLFEPLISRSADFFYLFHLGIKSMNFEKASGNFDLRLHGRITDNIAFGQGLRFRFANEVDTLGPQPWRDIAQAYLSEGVLKLHNERIDFIIGRRSLFLGPGDEHSLLLSSAIEGYDGYIFTYKGRYYEFLTSFFLLDAEEMRFLATHRLGLNLNFFSLGFSESILWADEIEPLYLNFLLPYYQSQWGIYRNDNIMWSFDGKFRLFNTILYGEFLIDDYQYSEPPPGYTEYPHKLAYQFGAKTIIKEKFYLKFNYTFVDKWVYTHRISDNIYINDSLPLGFPLGNDVDRLSFDVKFLNHKGITPYFKLEGIRKGEGSIYVPYEVERGSANPPFPSPVVEKNLKVIIGLDVSLHRNLYLDVNGGRQVYENFGHISGQRESENIFDLNLILIF